MPPPAELRSVCHTITGLPAPDVQLACRLHTVTKLMADAKSLPAVPLLLWREPDQTVRHVLIGERLVVGRQAGAGLALPGDDSLSRRHFLIRAAGGDCVLEDLKSNNGTAINLVTNRVRQQVLRDGDLILAGRQIFVFLDQGRTN